MIRLFRIGVCIGVLVVWFNVNNDPVLAEHLPATVVSSPIHPSMPPLPQFSPRIGPFLTYLYQRETTVPTTTEKWIDVDLSEQRVVAYEGTNAVRTFVVSTGLPATPTVKGTFRVRMKVRVQTMTGGSAQYGYYYLPNVEWVQYFHEDYAFHGTYWHNNFGQPMSHGCINMTNEDAKWLFEWAGPIWEEDGPDWQKPKIQDMGTLVVIHD